MDAIITHDTALMKTVSKLTSKQFFMYHQPLFFFNISKEKKQMPSAIETLAQLRELLREEQVLKVPVVAMQLPMKVAKKKAMGEENAQKEADKKAKKEANAQTKKAMKEANADTKKAEKNAIKEANAEKRVAAKTAKVEEAERVAAEACVRQDDESKCTSRTDCTWKKPGKCTKKSRTPHEMSVEHDTKADAKAMRKEKATKKKDAYNASCARQTQKEYCDEKPECIWNEKQTSCRKRPTSKRTSPLNNGVGDGTAVSSEAPSSSGSEKNVQEVDESEVDERDGEEEI